MRAFPPSTKSDVRATLVALGFIDQAGVLEAPAGAAVTLASIGQFFELKISLENGNTVSAVVAKSAIKITREQP